MDNLKTPAHKFYSGTKLFAKHDRPMDAAGRVIILEACRRREIKNALQHQYKRRVYSDAYLKRDTEKRQMYLSDFDQLGARWVKDADDVATRQNHGWYTDAEGSETLIGVVLCFTRGGFGGMEGNDSFDETKPKGRVIYMAGTRHSDWDGVTVALDTTDDPITAARWADSMAEGEAESCREEEAESCREEDELLRNSVQGCVEEIATLRGELEELK